MKVEESAVIIKALMSENKITRSKPYRMEFFMAKSTESLTLAKQLLSQDLSNMWVINIAYYSMFFAGTSLLAHLGKEINEEKSIHKLTYHSLIYFCLIENNKLQKHFIEEYKDAYDDAQQLLLFAESKALSMIQDYEYERDKRKRFTYDMGEIAERNKATTSVTRAEYFVTEVRKIMLKK